MRHAFVAQQALYHISYKKNVIYSEFVVTERKRKKGHIYEC